MWRHLYTATIIIIRHFAYRRAGARLLAPLGARLDTLSFAVSAHHNNLNRFLVSKRLLFSPTESAKGGVTQHRSRFAQVCACDRPPHASSAACKQHHTGMLHASSSWSCACCPPPLQLQSLAVPPPAAATTQLDHFALESNLLVGLRPKPYILNPKR